MASVPNELTEFHQFLTAQLHDAPIPPSPEKCLEMWRTRHPSAEELRQSSAAVKQALQDMEAGDTGKSARSLINDARQRHGLARDA